MKVLFCSYSFPPSVGGIETVSRILASELNVAGHEIRLVTNTPGTTSFAFPILRQPSVGQLIAAFRWADVVFHNNISLRFAWPLLLVRKPWIVAHHTWIEQSNGKKGIAEKVKLRTLRHASNIAISSAVAQSLPVPTVVIPDPYDPETFHIQRNAARQRDLIFLGRLVSDKGVDILLDAIKSLAVHDLFPTLSIVGEGPERTALENQVVALGLSRQVSFTGTKTGSALAAFLNEHRIMVIPSRWEEPFGVVALEGIASGCVVIGTAGGGLAEAIGLCGLVVKNGDAVSLSDALRELMTNPAGLESFRSKAEAHLKKHQPAAIAEKYLEQFEGAIRAQAS